MPTVAATVTDRPDILDLIDAAVSDWTVSDDAMRFDPEPARPSPFAALAESHARIAAAFAAWSVDLAPAMRALNERVAAMAGSMRAFSGAGQAGAVPERTVQVDRWTGRRHRRRRR
jgi:hypothetical protein